MDSIYKGWDVHSYSATWNEWLNKQPELKKILLEDIPKEDILNSYNEYKLHESQKTNNINAIKAIDKMVDRFNSGSYTDPDLCGIKVGNLFHITWNSVKNKDETILKGFTEIIEDIGQTCLQGDSHRLLTYYIALN